MQKGATGRAWAILAAGAAIQIFTGVPAAWGVFNQPVTQEYGLSEGAAGWVFSLLIAAFGVGCVIGGFLQDQHGPRCAALWGTGLLCGGMFGAAALPSEAGGWFWAVFSLPVGLGTAFLYPAIQSCAQKWFQDRKGLATGVIGGAVGLSGAFLTVFVRGTAAGIGPVQGIRGAFWALGGLCLPVCLGGSLLLKDPPPSGEKQPETGLDLGPGQMLRTRNYWLCAGAVCFSTPAVLLFSPIILQLCAQRGLAEGDALWAVVLGSVGSAAGRLLMPMLSDKLGRRMVDLGLFAASFALSGDLLAGPGMVGRGGLCRADLLLLGTGGGAAGAVYGFVRSAPRRGQLWIFGAGTKCGQPCVPPGGPAAGAGERTAYPGTGRGSGGVCLYLDAGADRRGKKRPFVEIDKKVTKEAAKAWKPPIEGKRGKKDDDFLRKSACKTAAFSL